MHNLKEIRKDFENFKIKLKNRNIDLNIDNLKDLDEKNFKLEVKYIFQKKSEIFNILKILESFKNLNFSGVITTHLFRNIGFAIIVNSTISMNRDSNYHAAIGGFVGSILTQPFDNLKTWYQSGNKKFPKHWKLKNYMVLNQILS